MFLGQKCATGQTSMTDEFGQKYPARQFVQLEKLEAPGCSVTVDSGHITGEVVPIVQ